MSVGARILQWLRGPLIFVTFLLVLAIVWFAGARLINGPLPFDRTRWDSAPYWEDTTRHRMADGLLESGRLTGKSRAEIVSLLGEPPPTSYFDEFDLVYNLGSSRGFISLDSEWLVMRIGETGRVSEALLVED